MTWAHAIRLLANAEDGCLAHEAIYAAHRLFWGHVAVFTLLYVHRCYPYLNELEWRDRMGWTSPL